VTRFGSLSAMREFQVETAVGELAGIDSGGRGLAVLLVYGTGQNSAAWAPVPERLRARCRSVAIDLRGHGRTPLDSDDAEQRNRSMPRS
jgi:pimeloyl-ACP methyl ester carboxylesterase